MSYPPCYHIILHLLYPRSGKLKYAMTISKEAHLAMTGWSGVKELNPLAKPNCYEHICEDLMLLDCIFVLVYQNMLHTFH